jgi:hypothetical protein
MNEPCNIAAYLAEQERDCRRLANSSGEHTAKGEKWARLAHVMLEKMIYHQSHCEKCR